jgi:S-adenosylmethionine:tRNA ribosyltransferase-isomerase
MQIEAFRYSLQPENIEGTPREIRFGRRDLSRLLVVDRRRGTVKDSKVRALPEWLHAGDVLVLNNSKRIPGVLKGRTRLGGLVEFRFVDLREDGSGLCRIFPTHDVRQGDKISVADDALTVVDLNVTKYELAVVRSDRTDLRSLLKAAGTPISGFFYEGPWTSDHLNPYYATEEGTVESPLAGLHFTPDLVEALIGRGVHVCFITLHSVGSWLPFLESDVQDHKMWAESFHVPLATAVAIEQAHRNGRRVVACGSTTLRALETAATDDGRVVAMSGRTDLYVTPGYGFRVVDVYFTNFHQYQTSLIVLDAAFAGAELVMDAYREASRRHYSFYEFGDAVMYV